MMNRKALGGSKIHFASLILVFGIILTISFVFAAHVITTSTGGTSYSANEDVGFIYNITVNNTDTANSANITRVNITIPNAIFIFLAGSNATDAGTHTFTNTSGGLSWSNDGLVMNLTRKNFWFNATASTPGSYNITVATTNGTGSFSSNISVTINDTTPPSSINFVSPTEDNNSNLSKSNIAVNITAADNGVIGTIIIRLFNSTRNQINSSSSSTSPVFVNFTGLSDGVYYFNATVNDSYGNSNSTATKTVVIDTTSPTISLSDSATRDSLEITITSSDSGTGVSGLCTSNLGSVAGNTITYSGLACNNAYDFSVTCTDYAGNVGSLAASFSTSKCISGGAGGRGGGVTGEYTWTKAYVADNSSFAAGDEFRKTLATKNRLKFYIGGVEHTLGVLSIGTNSIKIVAMSDAQEVTLVLGETKKFEVTRDSYYDVQVKLNSITANGADLSIRQIHETVPAALPETEKEAAPSEDASKIGVTGMATAPTTGFMSKYPALIIAGGVAVVLAAISLWIALRKRK